MTTTTTPTPTATTLNVSDLAAVGVVLVDRLALPVGDIPAAVVRMVPDVADSKGARSELVHLVAAAMYRRISDALPTIPVGPERDRRVAALFALSAVVDEAGAVAEDAPRREPCSCCRELFDADQLDETYVVCHACWTSCPFRGRCGRRPRSRHDGAGQHGFEPSEFAPDADVCSVCGNGRRSTFHS